MKKLRFFVYILILFMCGESAFSLGKRIAVFNPQSEGISSSEENWLPASIRRKLEANFNDYTDYVIVDVQNESEIKSLQKKAEGANYDQSSSIQLGKLVSAEYGLFSTVTYANGKYILSVNITNLTTGLRLSSSTTDSVTASSSLFEGAGSSVNIITVKFCEDLGITLSAIDKYVLLKGDDLSSEEELTMTEKEIDLYKTKMDELEKQLNSTKLSTELDQEAFKAKLEAEKALLKERQKLAQERLERLQKERQQLLADQMNQMARSDAQKKRIESVAKEAELKAKQLRQTKLENLSVDGQIAIIEAKKQALIDIRKSILEQEAMILKTNSEDYAKAAAEIDDVPLRMAEKDRNGKILPEVKAARDEKKKELKAKYDEQAIKDIQAIKGKTIEQEKSLLEAIAQDQKTLKTKHTVSSISDPSILFIGNYDGKRHIWEATASLSIGDNVVFSQSANINYESLTGKKYVAPGGNSELYEEYLDTVDLYDSMFRRKVPVISLEIDYTVEAEPESSPSGYKLTISNFRYIDVFSGKIIQTIVPAKTVFTFTINPVVDIRYGKISDNMIEEKKGTSKTTTKKTTKKTTKTETKTESKTETKTETTSSFELGRLNIGVTSSLAFASTSSFMPVFSNIYLSVPLGANLFIQGEAGAYNFDSNFLIGGNRYSLDDGIALGVFVDAGLNYKLNLLGWRPDLYGYAGAGWIGSDNLYLVKNGTAYEDSGFSCWKAGVGIDFPYRQLFCLSLEYTLYNIEFSDLMECFTVGIAISI